MVRPILPRGSNQNLTGPARLDVEGNGITADRVRTLQIPEFYQLMPQESGIAISDDQVSFSFFDFDPRSEIARVSSRSIHQDSCGNLETICIPHSPLSRVYNRLTKMKRGSPFLRAFH